VKYTIAKAYSLGGLEREVNKLIERGYKPVGGASTIKESGSSVLAQTQAMVKDVE
jgi:hypothetical protein